MSGVEQFDDLQLEHSEKVRRALPELHLSESKRRIKLADCLDEVKTGVGNSWAEFPVLGATRAGLAAAKEPVGKNPERYKLVVPGTVFYNPMRILLGSIAMVDDGEPPGITSPDYVVFNCRAGVLHFRWFYYWLRSSKGDAFIKTIARGAVRERILFRRLAAAEIEIPTWTSQVQCAERLRIVECALAAAGAQLAAGEKLAAAYLRQIFDVPDAKSWERKSVAEIAELLPSKSINTIGDADVEVATTACLTEWGFDNSGVKKAKMLAKDVQAAKLHSGEVLIARSNTPELVGRVSFYSSSSNDLCVSDLMIRLMIAPPNRPEFYASFLSSLYVRGYWRDRAGGASGSMKKITRTQIMSLQVPVPPVEIQIKVSRELSERFVASQRLYRSMASVRDAIAGLRPALLRKAFSGEL